MENATDALKIAFAILIFVGAITLSFSFISQAKTTSDAVLYYSDDTNFYDYSDSKGTNRTVDTAQVIATLYRQRNESIAVIIKLEDGSITTFDTNNNINKDDEDEKEEFIKKNLLPLKDVTFTEEFVEVPTIGKYLVDDEHDSQIAIEEGTKTIYITYTQQE